jgi:alpha-glucosidase
MRAVITIYIFLAGTLYVQGQAVHDTVFISSPDGLLRIAISTQKTLHYSVTCRYRLILDRGMIDMELNDHVKLSDHLVIDTVLRSSISRSVHVPIAYRSKNISDQYNEAILKLSQPFDIIFRLYDQGYAYRIASRFKDSITVTAETADFQFIKGCKVTAPFVHPREQEDLYHTSFEENYQIKSIDSLDEHQWMFSPIMIDDGRIKTAITESDLDDYPGMFLKSSGTHGLKASFAPYPLEERLTDADYPERIVVKRADYIAKTIGTRNFPWRIVMIADEDKDLPTNDMVYLLAAPSVLKDVSWIKPGLCTDEWIIDINLFNVPFKSGINTASYKYYIDFAKRFGFDRIMLDAGWSDTKDLFKINPNMDMQEIIRYARSNGIKLNLWTCAATLDRQLDSALTRFNQWGIDFIMTDFIDRDDQLAVNFCKRIAEACARHKIMIMFHGIYPPKGFNRTFPNNITREAVLGSEYNAWSDKASPDHDLILPFTRMLAGPMDYEPGILDNATKAQFKPIWGKVMSQGTRCHQLAMFLVYDSPLQIFSGNPSQGWKEPDIMQLIGSIPRSWDTTIVIDGKVGDYIITARKQGDDWYIGSMTDWTARDFKFPLKFLRKGKYEVTICSDGINADRNASDYRITKSILTSTDSLHISMSPGGGNFVRLKKIN